MADGRDHAEMSLIVVDCRQYKDVYDDRVGGIVTITIYQPL